jgi:HSP20 family protein
METRPARRNPSQPFPAWGTNLDRFFDDLWGRASAGADAEMQGVLAPAIDVAEDASALRITAELPGIDRKDIQLEVKDGLLTLRGEKKSESESKEGNLLRRERCFGSFYRALALPESADASKVAATFKNGVLKIEIPKREDSKPRAIAIRE